MQKSAKTNQTMSFEKKDFGHDWQKCNILKKGVDIEFSPI